MDKTYNYREEIDKIIKEKNIVFYDKYFNEKGEKIRTYDISHYDLQMIDILERKMSIILDTYYYGDDDEEEYEEGLVYEELPDTPKEFFIKVFKECIFDKDDLEEKDSKNFLDISDYQFSLDFWLEIYKERCNYEYSFDELKDYFKENPLPKEIWEQA